MPSPLTQLSTVKTRLGIPELDVTNDALLAVMIVGVSARFDLECSRTLARTVNATYEFDPGQVELCPPCYPLESVAKFELKDSEAAGWQEVQPAPEHFIRKGCIISLRSPLSTLNSQPSICRVTYTGGYVLPGEAPDPGQTPLPPGLEQAAVEQVAYWFQNRERIGLKTFWPSGDAYRQFATQDLLESVRAILFQYRRWEM